MRILACGSRHWWDGAMVRRAIFTTIEKHKEKGGTLESITLIHGDCQGADRLAAEAAKMFGITNIQAYPADWEAYGKAAGPIRNMQMVDTLTKGDVVLAFWNGSSKGTKHTFEYAKTKPDLDVQIWMPDND